MIASRHGFTLIELLLTLGVLAIGLISIFGLLPGISEFSRELRDQDRMQTFASAVFDSMAWSISTHEEGGTLSEEEQHRLPTLLGAQSFHVGEGERRWPDTDGVDELLPLFYYKVEVSTTSVSEVELRLQIRPESSPTFTEFTRTVYVQAQAW
ncbi:type II secretion system protein [Kiritimatiellota bacterium B12222]|nr:type II secretion system protein [Kiritimatiellota bacterium B12222]